MDILQIFYSLLINLRDATDEIPIRKIRDFSKKLISFLLSLNLIWCFIQIDLIKNIILQNIKSLETVISNPKDNF
jgi:hypothetical protein